MKKVLLALLFSAHLGVNAQNLIPNGSFEEFESCPDDLRQLDRAKHWSGANTGSPELFHACGFENRYVQPFDGEGMAGLILHADYSNSVEYLQVTLTDSLVKGKTYCFSYQIRAGNFSPIMINKIGAHFSRKKLSSPNWEPFYLRPTVFEKEIVDNRDNWRKISTQFTAKGGERFFIFGNFFEQHFLKEKLVQPPKMNWYTYYFVDDFQLYPTEDQCDAYGRNLEPKTKATAPLRLSIYFEVDSFRILEAEIERLDAFFADNRIEKQQWIDIKGFTDNDASLIYNQDLSQKRVNSVNNYLKTLGYANTKLSWFGEEKPSNTNANDQEKSINRRVDIFISP